MQESVPGLVPRDTIIETLRKCDGVYECPLDGDGEPLGPLVGYDEQYEDREGRLLHYVGFAEYNVAKGDQWPHIAHHWAWLHAQQLAAFQPDLLVAAPMGGISYMSVLKQQMGCRGIFAEEKVIEQARDGKRKKSKLVLGRYEVHPGNRIILVEDVVHNFSTTNELVRLMEDAGGHVVAVSCLINRSDRIAYWGSPERDPLPVISLQHKSTPQYKQDHPAVAEHVKVGDVVWDPKDQWDKLVAKEAEYA